MINYLAARAKPTLRRLNDFRLGVKRLPPNYAFKPKFRSGDIAIDVETGNDPDFSKYLIANYGLECFAVDPTRKHAPALRKLERELPGFHYLPYALGAHSGRISFYESLLNISGSLLLGHHNVVNDPIVTYDVDMVTLEELLHIISKQDIVIMKIDLEGAKYDLLNTIDLNLLQRIGQLIVEFHHGTISGITQQDTDKSIDRIEGGGMKAYVYNGRDCLFYW